MHLLKLNSYLPRMAGMAVIMAALSMLILPMAQAQDSKADALEQRIESMEAEIKRLKEEADVRKKLTPTESEQEEAETEALFAAGREYATLKKHTLGVEYRFNYAYNSYDIISQAVSVEEQVDHTLTNTIFAEYGLRDNLAVNMSLPIVYKYDRLGQSDEDSVTDLGDLSLGVTYQPFKSSDTFPTTLFFGNLTLPSGRSPYEINVDNDISTGNGAWAATLGASFSKTQDPVVLFGSLFTTYYLPIKDLNQNRGSDILREVELGSSVAASVGFAFSLSYTVSMNISYAYTYTFENDYEWAYGGTSSSGTATHSTFSLGTGWRISPKTSVSVKLTVGLTSNDSDFAFSCRIPFNFDLSKKEE
ncbi:MAG: hypothetical protein HUN04_25105 [Desulfobacter sp.]|nr:MAG: hypothetical protein HUN04_25105 [Desulfobacter sp.]